MRPIKYIFFIFGLLALYAFSTPFAPVETGVAERIEGDVAVRAFSSYADVEHGLEKRRSRGGGGESSYSNVMFCQKSSPNRFGHGITYHYSERYSIVGEKHWLT